MRTRPTVRKSATSQVESAAGEPEAADLNERIIELLQLDGRMPYATIATQIGVSEGTVRNRVRQLIDDNVITIQAEALPSAFGYKFSGLTLIKVAPGADITAVAERFAAIDEVFYLIMVLGHFDLGVATYHRDDQHFREFLIQHCYGHKDILTIDTNLVLKIHKMKLKWNLLATADGAP
ncbi:MAG TPA: AsnC family transcriptional regulator [Steroidobacteraceae bacterium]|nr:AsnC family transcriptional regulator [Steroidobacteraceae bacterium]